MAILTALRAVGHGRQHGQKGEKVKNCYLSGVREKNIHSHFIGRYGRFPSLRMGGIFDIQYLPMYSYLFLITIEVRRLSPLLYFILLLVQCTVIITLLLDLLQHIIFVTQLCVLILPRWWNQLTSYNFHKVQKF